MQKIISKIQSNWKPGLTVALVSIPLSVSLAVASGANPIQGIITAVWAGLAAAIFGGSIFNIVGPAGALSGILAAFVVTHGPVAIPSLAIFAGIFILLAYIFKLDKYLVFIPAAAVHGFTLGVAILLVWGQIGAALGLPKIPVHEMFWDNLIETFRHLSLFSSSTFFIFIIFLAALFTVLKLFPKIPSVLAIAPFGILVGYLSTIGKLGFSLVTLGSKYPDFHGALWNSFKFTYSYDLIGISLTIALVAILETMLSAKIADGMTKTKYNRRREMLGLGLANVVSGFFGGLPATGVLARTALNIKSGANSKTSAAVNSVMVGVISLIFLNYFRYIPMSVIAAILTFVAVRMVEAEHFSKMWKFERGAFFISFLVAGVTVFEDPVKGIMLGTGISLLILVERISRGQFHVAVNHAGKGVVHTQSGHTLKNINIEGDTLVYSIKGQLLHLNAHAHLARFEKGLERYKNVVLRLKELHMIDIDGIECVSELIETFQKQGKKVAICGVDPFIEDLLQESLQYRKLEKEGMVFAKTSEALRKFGYKV